MAQDIVILAVVFLGGVLTGALAHDSVDGAWGIIFLVIIALIAAVGGILL